MKLLIEVTNAQFETLRELYRVAVDHCEGRELSDDCKQLAKYVVDKLDNSLEMHSHF